MQPTTLRGVFPDRPTVHRRNFIRENVKRIKQIQEETQDLRAKSDSNAKFGQRLHLSTSLSKLKLVDESTAKTSPRQQARRPGIQKLEIRPAEKKSLHISDLVVINNISHRSMQTELSEDMTQIYSTGVIKYPTNVVAALCQQRKRNNSMRRMDPGNGDSPDVYNTAMPKIPAPSPGDMNHRTDFIRNNVMALKARSVKKNTIANDPNKLPPNYKRGVMPKYIKPKKEPEEEIIDDDCPPGHVLLPEEERKETLRVLRESYADKIQEMNSMPVRSDTLKMQKRKMDLEIELKKIDEGIKVFQRPKVYVKVNV